LGNGFVYLKYAWSIKITDSDLNSAPPLVAKTCELPRFSVETQIVNVYNHKTIVQTKLNYEPITMSFYDQTNGTAESMIWNFVKDQFDPIDASKANKFKPLTIEITMKNLSEPGAAPKVYTLTNAFIVDAQHDTLDYATSEPVLWTITVRYEDLKAPGFEGPTPIAPPTGIKALPKPPKPPVANDKKKSDSSFTPITKPPKADAVAETKKPNFGNAWTNAGGTVTGGGAATGNPTLTNQTRLGNPNIRPGSLRDRVARANAAREAARAWPGGTPNGTASTNSVAAGTVNPSTGSNIPATSNKQPENSRPTSEEIKRQKDLTVANTEFLKKETAYVKESAGMNPEYQKAYLEGLEKYPPRSKSLQSQEASRQQAETLALSRAPRYASQVRTNDAGVSSANANLKLQEPAPNPVREGTSVIRAKPNDTKGNELVSRQVQLEQAGIYKQPPDSATNQGRIKKPRDRDY
jgi:hypothetical protein